MASYREDPETAGKIAAAATADIDNEIVEIEQILIPTLSAEQLSLYFQLEALNIQAGIAMRDAAVERVLSAN